MIHSRYVTDMLNMLQGVYIFWAFVCNRRVLNIIFGREKVDRMERSTTRLYRQVVNVSHRTQIMVIGVCVNSTLKPKEL